MKTIKWLNACLYSGGLWRGTDPLHSIFPMPLIWRQSGDSKTVIVVISCSLIYATSHCPKCNYNAICFVFLTLSFQTSLIIWKMLPIGSMPNGSCCAIPDPLSVCYCQVVPLRPSIGSIVYIVCLYIAQKHAARK